MGLKAVVDLAASGIVSSVTGTAAEITASPTTGPVILSLPTALTFTGKTVTGGTFSAITLSGTIPGTPTYSGVGTFGAGITISSGQVLKLGNAATTGLTAGVLAALTNATIVISDSTGQAYRIPCII